MSTNSKYVYFTINGSKVCLFDIYTNEVLKEINIPSVIKDKELIITMFAIPAAAVMMDVSAVVYKYQLSPFCLMCHLRPVLPYLFIGCTGSSLLCRLFSSGGKWGLLSYWSEQVSHCVVEHRL